MEATELKNDETLEKNLRKIRKKANWYTLSYLDINSLNYFFVPALVEFAKLRALRAFAPNAPYARSRLCAFAP